MQATVLCLLVAAAVPTDPVLGDDPDRLGILPLPDSYAHYHREGFTKYAEVVAPNGESILLIAQPGVRDIAVARARNLLAFFLTDVPGTKWGNDKRDVADAMADNGAVLMMPEGRHVPGREPHLDAQPLFEHETPVEGSRWYMQNDWAHRDAAFEEIFHLVHDFGFGTDRIAAHPGLQAELLREAKAAIKDERWGIPVGPDVRDWLRELDHENSLAQEYIAAVLDTYYGLWGAWDERDGGMWGIYVAKTRDELAVRDPRGLELIESFLPPMMHGYEALIDPDFDGTFTMSFDPDEPYTHKSQYLVDARLTGTRDASLVGNDEDNRLAGNRGDNEIDGGKGTDTAVFVGEVAEYAITVGEDGTITVADGVPMRDGTDRLRSIEFLQFADRTKPAP